MVDHTPRSHPFRNGLVIIIIIIIIIIMRFCHHQHLRQTPAPQLGYLHGASGHYRGQRFRQRPARHRHTTHHHHHANNSYHTLPCFIILARLSMSDASQIRRRTPVCIQMPGVFDSHGDARHESTIFFFFFQNLLSSFSFSFSVRLSACAYRHHACLLLPDITGAGNLRMAVHCGMPTTPLSIKTVYNCT